MNYTSKRKPIEFYVDERGCHICTSHYINKDGYPIYCWRGKITRMSRALYGMKFGDIPNGLVVRHKCNNRGCINIDHLCVGTQADNVWDSVMSNTHRNPVLSGEDNGYAKLTKREVLRIYSLKDNHNLTLDGIAEKLGGKVSRSTIHLILQEKIWKDVALERHR